MKAIHDIGAALFNRHPPRFSTGLYSSELILEVSPLQRGRSLSVPRVNRTGGVEITAREDLVALAQVLKGLVQQSPVLQGLGGKPAGLGVKEFLFNPAKIIGPLIIGIDVGVVARGQDSCPRPVVVNKEVQYPRLFFPFLV